MTRGHLADLVLGSVQLGLSYGVANRTGKPSLDAALKLVRRAAEAGIETFDTARAYGDSEARLGIALNGNRSARIVTKLSPLTELAANASREDVLAAVDRSASESMVALKRGQLDCLLLHRAEHIAAYGGAIWERLVQFLKDGTVLSLGVSVQSPAEAMQALSLPEVQHIQLPFNLLDWRWRQSDVIDRLRKREQVTVHARSALLQGLLTAADPCLWPAVPGVEPEELCIAITCLARELGRLGPADLCLAYVRGQDWIDAVVVGMETEDQVATNVDLFARPPLCPEERRYVQQRLPLLPEQLLNPALWPPRS